jgi:hypothetical protein
VKAWLQRHQRFTFHFTPTSCSWANAVEGLFAKLTRHRLKRGVFTSIVELQAAINRFIADTNDKPKPFVWTKSTDAILVPLARVWLACRKLARRADPPGATVAILCLKHLGETCAPADWPRRMPCRKLRPRAPVQGAAGVVTARTLFVKGIKYG